MPHIARTLNPAWDVTHVPVRFVRITGKGNIRRYRSFFDRFGIRVPVIADLDLLISGFDHIIPNKMMTDARSSLIAKLDELIVPDVGDTKSQKARSAHESDELRNLWRAVKEHQARLKEGTCSQEAHDAAVEAFFGWQRKPDRLSVLRTSTDARMLRLKHELLEMLRVDDIYVLERGAIEQYYPSTVSGPDKPSRAQDFCIKVATRNDILACCGERLVDENGRPVSAKEFDLIFGRIFEANPR